ncbi:Mannan endo-1,4-beta-mannosidase A [Psilocybe cubensis]|uniref:Mannan endo-1,4-beta-mannosidase A n=1 Tax=Psilocybe cubensis TaxID=181762 RepID=A0ACB8H8N9_PSICU|nr:Mannan endo-1,4-beta-mannosidase A [Psilocybe cubensis]KAH9484283.1 Mannan endo-1,4-beta-mannosidase A [Psilocybe cubensis]
MYLPLLWKVTLSALLVSAQAPTRTLSKRQDSDLPQFVTTQNGNFMFKGKKLDFVGTNAYWLAALNSDDDIDFTLGNMSAAGVKIVRTWAFNDVETIPVNGTWFQLISNGTTTINNGTNGLQKLDTVVRLAEKHGLFLHLSLTNNWNPRPLLDNPTAGLSISARDVTNGTNNTLPRNTLSNDYGGMDVYVRQFGNGTNHDEFYLNPAIVAAFKNYTTQIVSRYVNSPAIFGCVDPNHLVASGNQGFFCADCPKLFPRKPVVVPPPPQVSSTPNSKRRRGVPQPLTKKKILQDRKAAFKKSRKMALQKRTEPNAGGIRIRGRWVSTETKRQSTDDQGVGPAFDGSQGVDSEDILGISNIAFSTFQLFPDQNTYGVDDPSLPKFNNTVNQGLAWIRAHADIGRLFNKPVILNGFGLVTQSNAPFFVPFNSTQAPFGPDSVNNQTQAPFGVTDQQRDDAYTQWLQAGLAAGLQGMLQYQWSQGNLTTAVGTVISPTVDGTSVSPDVTGTGVSPDDGYSIQGQGFDQAVNIIQQASQQFAADVSS